MIASKGGMQIHHSITRGTLLLGLAACFTACLEDESEDVTGTGGAGGSGGEAFVGGAGGVAVEPPEPSSCIEYDPVEAGETINDSWAEAGASNEYSFTVPDEPGGGYVTLTVDTDATDMTPSIVIQAEGDTGGSVLTESSIGRDDQSLTEGHFEVAPGMTYNVTVGQISAAAEPYPNAYTMTWTYTGVADCYEPNDEATEAKAIQLDEEVTAYSLAGFLTNSFSNPSLTDWYSVEIEESGVLEVDMTQTPGPDRMSIRIFTEDMTSQVGSGGNADGVPFTSTTDDPVPAGIYLIEVVTAQAAGRTAEIDHELPSAWSTPYVIRATLR